MKDSFQQGLRDERMVLVFCLVSFFGSGMSLSLTYGSDKPFGSIGIRFLASPTRRRKGDIINTCVLKPSRLHDSTLTQGLEKQRWSVDGVMNGMEEMDGKVDDVVESQKVTSRLESKQK